MPREDLRRKVLVADMLFRFLEAFGHFAFEALQLLVFPAQHFHLRDDVDPVHGFGALGLQTHLRPHRLKHFLACLALGRRCRGPEHVRHRRMWHHFLQDLMDLVQRTRETLLARVGLRGRALRSGRQLRRRRQRLQRERGEGD